MQPRITEKLLIEYLDNLLDIFHGKGKYASSSWGKIARSSMNVLMKYEKLRETIKLEKNEVNEKISFIIQFLLEFIKDSGKDRKFDESTTSFIEDLVTEITNFQKYRIKE